MTEEELLTTDVLDVADVELSTELDSEGTEYVDEAGDVSMELELLEKEGIE